MREKEGGLIPPLPGLDKIRCGQFSPILELLSI